MVKRCIPVFIAAASLGLPVPAARAVILYGVDTSNPSDPGSTAAASAPTGALAGSGWQYEFPLDNFLATPIAANYFITANHIGDFNGASFGLNGQTYTVTGSWKDPNTDLHLYQVDKPFGAWAPLYTGANEVGQPLVVFGRGTQRGTALAGPQPAGWNWGADDHVQRWGTNTVDAVVDDSADGLGNLLSYDFSTNAGNTEAILSSGDSGGGVFIRDNGVWKLAGINYGVDVGYPTANDANANDYVRAGLTDMRGLYPFNSAVPYEGVTPIPASSYSTQISSRVGWIESIVVPEPGSATLVAAGAIGALLRRRHSCRRPERSEG